MMTFLGVEGETMGTLRGRVGVIADGLEACAGLVQIKGSAMKHKKTNWRIATGTASEGGHDSWLNERVFARRKPPRALIEKSPPNFSEKRQII
jgi:hypothetical protein